MTERKNESIAGNSGYSTIVVHSAKCTGCRSCESVCALTNNKWCGPTYARIRLVQYNYRGEVLNSPVICQNCCNPPCESICPTGATRRNSKTGLMDVAEELCIGCKGCIYSCPFGACFINPGTDKAFRCNHCDGDPACVEACPEHVLNFVRSDQVNSVLRRKMSFLAPLVDLNMHGEERI